MENQGESSGDLQNLFVKIIESLSAPVEVEDTVSRILTEVCEHFRFGCGFVYEMDHTQTFHLKERYSKFANDQLPQSFRLDTQLSPEEREKMLRESVYYQSSANTAMERIRESGLFHTNSLMLIPVFSRDKQPISLIGMMDRRRDILLNQGEVHNARMVLNLLANNVKLRLYQRSLENAEQSLISILDNSGLDIFVADYETREIIFVNKTIAAAYGGAEKVVGKKCWELHGDTEIQCNACPQFQNGAKGEPGEVHSWDYRRNRDGRWFRVVSSVFTWVDGRLAFVVSSIDITETKRQQATIARMANHDALTNLPNRRKLMGDLNNALRQAEADNGYGYLMFMDLDDFKKLNDSMGHLAGDELLTKIGEFMQAETMTRNHAYRYGGDEFVLLYRDAERDMIVDVVKFLLDRFQKPWPLRDTSPVCNTSIGVARYPDNGTTPEELLNSADALMYQSKFMGRCMASFSDGEIIRPEGSLDHGEK